MVCRLCLGTSANVNKEYFDLNKNSGHHCSNVISAWPCLDLSLTETPQICKECSTLTEELHRFKDKCEYVERTILSYKENCCTPLEEGSLDLKDVLNYNVAAEKFIRGDVQVCRSCLLPDESSDKNTFGSVKSDDGESSFSMCVALGIIKMDLNLTSNPMFCKNCIILSNQFLTFHNKVFKVQNTIKDYINKNNKSSLTGIELLTFAIKKEDIPSPKIEVSENETETKDLSSSHTNDNTVALLNNTEIKREIDEQNLQSTECILKIEEGECSVKIESSSSDYDHNYAKDNLLVNNNLESNVYLIKEEFIDIDDLNDESITSNSIPKQVKLETSDESFEEESGPTEENYMSSTKIKTELEEEYNLIEDPAFAALKNKSKRFKLYHCPHCEHKEKTKTLLDAHVSQHFGLDKSSFLQCNLCGMRTPCKMTLNKHVNEVHPNSNVYHKCKECDFSTMWKSGLKRHMKFCHGDKETLTMFKCPSCDFETRYKSVLKRHNFNKHINKTKRKMVLVE